MLFCIITSPADSMSSSERLKASKTLNQSKVSKLFLHWEQFVTFESESFRFRTEKNTQKNSVFFEKKVLIQILPGN